MKNRGLPLVAAKWSQVRLGDHVDLLAGFAFKSNQFTDSSEDIHLVKGENVQQGYVDWDKAKHWPVADWEKFEKFQLRQGDVVLAMDRPWIEAGLKYGWITHRAPRALLVQRVSRLRGTDTLATNFLRFVIGSPAFTDYIRPITTGVNVPHISPAQIKDFKFVLPPVADQRRIASILSAYDDLIENNTRRIAILEEMARRIYEEWFVRFRFPGHEKVRMVESELGLVPEGWNVSPMGSVADVIDCLHAKKPEETTDGYGMFLQLNNIGACGILDLSKKFLISKDDYTKWTSRIEAQEGDCVITNVGRVGAVAQIPPGVKAALGRNMTGVRARKQFMTPTYLVQYLLSSHMTNEVQVKKDAGAIMDALNVKGIVRLSVPIPPTELMSRFDQLVRPLRRRLELLVSQNANLRTTRDLLLPKLISGELDVSHLPEPEAVAA